MQKLPTSPPLPQVFPKIASFDDTGEVFRTVMRAVFTFSRDVALRLNTAFMNDGSEPMRGPVPLQSVNVADLPDPTLWPGGLLFVPDASGGPSMVASDGIEWYVVDFSGVVS